MNGLYVYALVDAGARVTGAGLAGEPLRLVACDEHAAVVGEMDDTPAVDAAALRAHDAVVRALAETADAILPARFGSFVKDETALREALQPRARELGEALRLVRGCEQMTVRVYGTDTPTPAAEPPTDTAGAPRPGTDYLVSRQRERRRAREVPELDPLRPALATLVRDERAQRHRTPPLLASVYHLIERGQAATYQQTLTAAAASLGGVRVTASGPWPPYAFAPEALV